MIIENVEAIPLNALINSPPLSGCHCMLTADCGVFKVWLLRLPLGFHFLKLNINQD